MDLLQKLKTAEHHQHPFEHLIIHNFFDEDELNAIEQEYPTSKEIHDSKKLSNANLLNKCLNDRKYLEYLASERNWYPDVLLKILKEGANTNYSQNTTYVYQTSAESCAFYNMPKM